MADALGEHRRRYGEEIMRSTGSVNERVEAAFASVPREAYLMPPPWTIFSPGGFFDETTSDPAALYQDVLVVLSSRQGINNGQPSLHAAWIAAVDPQAGETVLHIGIGAGYYTAILAELVARGGHVHAYEIDPALAEAAHRNLASLDHVTVHGRSGVAAELPPADVIYVNAGVEAPDPAWLQTLKQGGRLIFPWQPARPGGLTMLIRREERGFSADATMAVGFIPCIGTEAKKAKAPSFAAMLRTRSAWLSAERAPDRSATAAYEGVWFSSEPVS